MSSAFEDFAHDAESVEAGHLSVVPNPFAGMKSNAEAEVDNGPEFFESEVEKQKLRILTLREAKRQIAAEESTATELPAVSTLAARLAAPREPELWRMDGLWPMNGRVNLVAAPKAGKTTLVTNLVRSLVDGDTFMGEFFTTAVPSRADGPSVIVFDFEMTEAQLLRWYESLNLENPDQVDTILLRGHGSAFDFMTPEVRRELVEKYGGAHTYILDPVGPLLTSLGLDENSNSDVQRFLATWDEFVRELSGKESAVTIHAGHNGERARGASTFSGSGDAIWRIVNPEGKTHTPRFFTAWGRDVDVYEQQYVKAEDNVLSLVGKSRKQVADESKAQSAVTAVVTALEGAKDPMSKTALVNAARKCEDATGSQPTQTAARKAVDLARDQGVIVVAGGRTKGELYTLPPS